MVEEIYVHIYSLDFIDGGTLCESIVTGMVKFYCDPKILSSIRWELACILEWDTELAQLVSLTQTLL